MPCRLRCSGWRARFFCLGLISLARLAPRAPEHRRPGAVPQPTAALVHLTDAQDRLMSGQLSPIAEARSRANALYAEAMLLPEDPPAISSRPSDLLRQVVALDPYFADAQIKLANLLLQSRSARPGPGSTPGRRGRQSRFGPHRGRARLHATAARTKRRSAAFEHPTP